MIVFDSWALLAFFQGEDAAYHVERFINQCWENGERMFISTINVGEIWYTVARRESSEKADEIVGHLKSLGIEMVDASFDRIMQASQIKKNGKLSYADAFAAALAMEKKATLLTGDFEFKFLEEQIDIFWLR
jgi:ribonuclease VapC